MSTPTDIEVAEAMQYYGGMFTGLLGLAFLAADSENRKRIKVAFPEAWGIYSDMAARGKSSIDEPKCSDEAAEARQDRADAHFHRLDVAQRICRQ